MQFTPPTFQEWHTPRPDEVGQDHVEFLRLLTRPTWMTIPGKDATRRRAIVTLLHGNEPSGLKAIHDILRRGVEPATDLGVFIANVNAASLEPVFSHRFLPDEEDLNRCFNPPYDTDQRRLAKALLDKLDEFGPEAIVDTHNTSAHSEPFAVTTSDSTKTLQLAQRFTRRLVLLDLSLGTLIEQQCRTGPIITVEFGGIMDPKADVMASETLEDFLTRQHLYDTEALPMMVLRHPHRLEVDDGTDLHYSSSVQNDADITIFNTIDQLNFSKVEAGTAIGWPGRDGIRHLRLLSADGEDILQDYFTESRGYIVTTQPVTLFMATTDPYIARKDCLLYVTPAE